MRRNRSIPDAVKEYLWGDGLDPWNTPRHEVHDYPLTNPLHDLVIWGNQGGPAAFGRYHLDKFMSGDYDSIIKEAASYFPIRHRRRSRPTVSVLNYKSSGSSSRAYQQNGSPGDTSKKSRSRVGAYRPWHDSSTGLPAQPCRPGYDLKKVKGNWMCVLRRTRKR